MKSTINLLSILFIPVLLLFTQGVRAQNGSLLLPEESSLKVTGSSTLHDWEAVAEQISLDVTLAEGFDIEAISSSAEIVQALSLSVPVSSLEGGKRGINSRIYDALREEDHPAIQYQYRGGTIADTSETSGNITINATGNLSIAGVTRSVSFPVQMNVNENGNLVFTGTYSLNMRDYNVEPPTAMLGTIKADELVEVAFNIVLATN